MIIDIRISFVTIVSTCFILLYTYLSALLMYTFIDIHIILKQFMNSYFVLLFQVMALFMLL